MDSQTHDLDARAVQSIESRKKMAKILIVDDAQIMRNILCVMLENAGHEIVGNATNGLEALKLYGELNPDLVTLDILMAGGSGMTHFKELLQIEPRVRVVLVSTGSKPFQAEERLAEIRNALAE